jgi:hypothetical protein
LGFKPRAAAEGERDRLAAEARSVDPSSERAAAIARELSRGFFAPRPEAVALDIERSVAILVGGRGLPALSDGPAASRWGRSDLPRHIDVPGGVSHPAASALRAAILGRAVAQLDALGDAEIYLGDGGELHLWPWYPEQDGELRPAAIARAAELDVEPPERFLDEPFEPAWYWTRTGEAALEQLFVAAGRAPPRLEVSAIPVFDHGEAIEWEGGGTALPAAAQIAQELAALAGHLEHVEDVELRDRILGELRDLLADYVAAVNGEPEPSRSRRATLELAGAPESAAASDEEPVAAIGTTATLRRVWASDGGAVVACTGAVVVVDASGAVRRAWPCEQVPWFCGAGLALSLDGDGWHALDLETGEWATGELDPIERFGGPLVRISPGDPWAGPSESPLSPDGRYQLDVESGILRIADHRWVGFPEVLGADEDDEDDGEENTIDAPALLEPGELVVPGVAVAEIDGVTFTARRRQLYRVIAERGAAAFVLAADHWRALIGRTLRRGREVVARVPLCFDAAFAPGGARLWLLLADHLVRVDWDGPTPRIGAVAPLEPIAAAAREVTG